MSTSFPFLSAHHVIDKLLVFDFASRKTYQGQAETNA